MYLVTLYRLSVISDSSSDVDHNPAGLSDAMVAHLPQFEAHCICGNDLLKMTRQQLEYLRVGQSTREGLFRVCVCVCVCSIEVIEEPPL